MSKLLGGWAFNSGGSGSGFNNASCREIVDGRLTPQLSKLFEAFVPSLTLMQFKSFMELEILQFGIISTLQSFSSVFRAPRFFRRGVRARAQLKPGSRRRRNMSKKSLLISVDAQDEANASQDVEISYVDDDFFQPIDDIDVFNVDPSIIHKSSHATNDDEENDDQVKFNVIINKDENFSSAPPKRYRNPRLHRVAQQKDFPDSDFLNSEESRTRRIERAKRFNLDVEMDEPRPVLPKPSEDDLRHLYAYFELDINDCKVKGKIRLNSLHVHGVSHFSTQDVFDYFDKYDPEYIEWVDDACCNVVWDKEDNAARAILDCSFPARLVTKNVETLHGQEEIYEDYVSPLKRNTEEETEVGKLELDKSSKSGYKQNADGSITVDRLLYLIPPGFRWRIGRKSETQSKILLLRFATIEDVKAPRSGSRSEFYRKNGNPNFDNAVGIISKSRRERTRHRNLDESFPGHIDYNRGSEDLRTKLRNVARWNEIRSCNRRNSDEDYSPYSDDDGAEKDSRRSKTRKPLRMKMRADDVESKLSIRKKQTDALLKRQKNLWTKESSDWRRSHSRYELDDRDDNYSDDEDRSDGGRNESSIKTRLGKHDRNRENGSERHPVRRSRSRSPLDVNSRLEHYRMKITVGNDASEGEILSDDDKRD
uniref:Nuclear cap-binding protein subunit 3 n=1 Tax=Romanomermis culicivorax TaxID=13658 RepID=A0A915K1J7_ROMCU